MVAIGRIRLVNKRTSRPLRHKGASATIADSGYGERTAPLGYRALSGEPLPFMPLE
jgi:hypothetical protein